MGLSIHWSIIENHGGRLWATRHEPRGVCFSLRSPRLRADHDHVDVSRWHLADVLNALTNVRFREQTGHWPTAATNLDFELVRGVQEGRNKIDPTGEL